MSTLNLLLLLAEAAAASIALPILAGLLARAYPRSASRRRLVWVTMFASLLALPLVTMYAPTLAVISLAPPLPGPATAMVPTADLAAAPAPVFSGTTGALILALCAWALGALWIVVRSLIGLVWLRRLRIDSASFPPERLRLPLPRGCSVRLSPDCQGPMTWGAGRAIILLPDEALDWPQEQLEAALRHELAHVARQDSLVQALALAACVLYWPNPLVWRAARALRQEAEAAADDAVIAAGMRPSDYANLLVDMAGGWPSRRRPALEVAMAAPPILTERVQSILSTDAIRTGVTAMDTFKFALMGTAALAALALARPSVAEVAAAPAPVAPGPTLVTGPGGPVFVPAPADKPAKPAVTAMSVTAPQGAAAPAPPAPPAGWAAPVWIPGPVTAIRYNPVTDDPASPGYIAPGQPGAGHPVPAALAKLLNARKAGAAAPWTLSWLPNPNGAPTAPRVISGRLTPEQQQKFADLVQRRAELDRQLAQVGPAIDKAIADAHIDQTVQKALSAQDAQTREMVAKELAEIGPRIQQQIASAHIRELRGDLLTEVQVQQPGLPSLPPLPTQPPKN